MSNEKKITLVTGFFNCKREVNENQRRSDNEYLNYFEFWARIQNNLIVFGNKEITQKAYDIRKKFGRENQTKIVIIEDPTECDYKIYEAMKKIENRGEFKKWRIRDYDISNEALYNHVMFMKIWAIKYVAENFPETEMLAWIDFGFNHGGKCYTNCEEFDYLWDYKFDENKVHLFALRNPENELGYLKLMCMTDGIMGAPFLCHSAKARKLYECIKTCIFALASLDVIDDDQMWLTMAYKWWPDMFEIHECDWFMALKEFGSPHLTTQTISNEKNIMKFIKLKGIKGVIKYSYVKLIYKMSVEKYDYWKRMRELIRDYE